MSPPIRTVRHKFLELSDTKNFPRKLTLYGNYGGHTSAPAVVLEAGDHFLVHTPLSPSTVRAPPNPVPEDET